MSLELFSKLREFDSLTKMKLGHEKTIKENEERLIKLQERSKENDLQSAKLKQEILSSRQKLHEIEQKLKMFQEQKQRLIETGQPEKAETYSPQIDAAEEEGLEILSLIENVENELKDKKTFHEGIQKTINEISSEVEEIKSQEKVSIENLNLRMKLIEEELPAEFKSTLSKVIAKNLAQGPFTKIDSGSCYFCRYKISRIDESEIDTQFKLKTCPQCSRIFLPYGA